MARATRRIPKSQTLRSRRNQSFSCKSCQVSATDHTISRSSCGEPRQKSCSNCSASFSCGPADARQSCWCEELPHVSLAADAEQDCLFPQCLNQAIANLPQNQSEMRQGCSLSKGSINSPPALIEGEDYYVEGPAIVFTAHYLHRRGYCCESGCRHC